MESLDFEDDQASFNRIRKLAATRQPFLIRTGYTSRAQIPNALLKILGVNAHSWDSITADSGLFLPGSEINPMTSNRAAQRMGLAVSQGLMFGVVIGMFFDSTLVGAFGPMIGIMVGILWEVAAKRRAVVPRVLQVQSDGTLLLRISQGQ